MLEIGLRHESQVIVTEQNTALTLGSGDMKVFTSQPRNPTDLLAGEELFLGFPCGPSSPHPFL